MKKPHIAIVGAGPGGLVAAMILAYRGFEVEVFEKEAQVGGRNGAFHLGDFTFDIGPTFLLQRFTLEEMFEEVGEKAEDHLDFMRLDPMYRLQFKHHALDCTTDLDRMAEQIAKHYPGNEQGVYQFMKDHHRKFRRIFPVLQGEYSNRWDLFRKDLFKALPYAVSQRSVYKELNKYFKNDELKLAFTFQSKYLGMSPWECPQIFTILPYIEYQFGLDHVRGGLHQISYKMAELAQKFGAQIHLNTPVKKVLNQGKTVHGLELESGEKIEADQVIVNADFGYAMDNLLSDPSVLHKWSPKRMKNRPFSCSTFMVYAGLDTCYQEMPHHTILFAEDYERNVREIVANELPSEDMSIYIHNPSVTDPTLAPEGKSALYILVPTVNNTSGYDWETQQENYYQKVLQVLERRTALKDLRQHIEVQKVFTPLDWEHQLNVFQGATFNLAHVMSQMLYWRPHNQFEELENVALVGGGTHPGSGLPTIYESGRITANLLSRRYGVSYTPPDTVKRFLPQL